MKKLLIAGAALIVAGSLAYTVALAQEATKTDAPASEAPKPAAPRRAAPKSADGRPVSTKSVAQRTALCKADCRPNNYKECASWGCTGMHGLYRSYNEYDPHLTSIEGKKQYAECVQKCVDPLPAVYVQRPLFAMGSKWFGKTKQSYLDCHAKGH